MKKYIYILVLGLITVACSNSNDNGVVISILEDTTETNFIAKPQPNTVVSGFGFDNDLWHSAHFRYGSISSLVHNKREELSLEGKNALFSNDIERKKSVATFKQGVRQTLEAPKDFSKGEFSSIWKPLIEELEVLQQNQINTSVLYLFSDLRENNKDWFSVYRYEDLLLLEHDIESVKKLFLKHATTINRHNPNIKVVVVYQPETMKEDASFSRLSKLYASVFEELGIAISFTTQI